MKQFSKMSGFNLPKEKKPVEVKKVNEEELFKNKVMNLMENLLSIRTYGPIDRYLRAGSIKISGKEHFLEALIDLLKEKSLKDETKILESLKSEIGDWEILDSKIDESKSEAKRLKVKQDLSQIQRKIKSMINTYSNDFDTLMLKVDESCSKINNPETAAKNLVAIKLLVKTGEFSDTTLMKISEKFEVRYKQLVK